MSRARRHILLSDMLRLRHRNNYKVLSEYNSEEMICMKNQYFGDIGDYGKYSLLRAFANEGIKVGVNWYLTEDDGSADGKYTTYLGDDKERIYDPELYDCLKQMKTSEERDVKTFEAKNMIPDAIYYRDMLDISRLKGIRAKQEERSRWHETAMETLRDAELIFMDPDNGLSIKEKSTRKDSVKYAFATETADYFERGQNIVYYCHKGRRTPKKWEEAKMTLYDYIPEAALIPLTFHRGTQRTFMFVIHREDHERYEQILRTFMESKWQKHFEVELVGTTYFGRGTSFSYPVLPGKIYPKGSTVKQNPDGTVTIVPPK